MPDFYKVFLRYNHLSIHGELISQSSFLFQRIQFGRNTYFTLHFTSPFLKISPDTCNLKEIFWDQKIYFEISAVCLRLRDIESGLYIKPIFSLARTSNITEKKDIHKPDKINIWLNFEKVKRSCIITDIQMDGHSGGYHRAPNKRGYIEDNSKIIFLYVLLRNVANYP